MTESAQGHETLRKAREALHEGKGAAMHLYFVAHISAFPDDGKALTEYLEAARSLHRIDQWIDVSMGGALRRFMPSQSPETSLETALRKLRDAPHDLNVPYRIGLAAVKAGWHSTVIAAFGDVLQRSSAARDPAGKLRRELSASLGRAHFAVGDHTTAIKWLGPFENDASAPKDLHQMLKDAAAKVAAESFKGRTSAHTIATPHSVQLATESTQDKASREADRLEAILVDPHSDAAKTCAAALNAADLYMRRRRFEDALNALHKALKRAPEHCDLEKKIAEVSLRRRDHAIRQTQSEARESPQIRSKLTRLLTERDEYVVKAYGDLARKMPADGEIHLRLGKGLLAVWKRTKDEDTLKIAISHFQFDYRKDEHHHEAQLLLAECFLGLNLPTAAEVVLADLLKRIEQTRKGLAHLVEAQYLLGLAREACGDTSGAARAYVSVIGKNIGYRDAFERLRSLDGERKEEAARR